MFPLLFALLACDAPREAQLIQAPAVAGPQGTQQQTGPTETNPTDGNTTGTTPPEVTDDCPPGVICIDSLPFVDVNTTTGAPSVMDGYGCAPTIDESGPEVLYRLEIAEEGFLAASLWDLPAGVDVDVHLLLEDDAGSCIDRGHWDAAALLEPGTYWVVVDSWVDSGGDAKDGDYTLELYQTTYGDYAGYGLDPDVLEKGLRAFDRAWFWGDTSKLEYGIMDYTMPSTEPRMFVMDLRSGGMLFDLLATHGIGTQDPYDMTMVNGMSNVYGSNSSSMGLVRAAEPYWGSNGYSMRLDGLEAGYNDNDRTRAIVIHGADYATQSFVNTYGYLGRSWGCPAVDPAANDQLIATLQDGGLLLKYWDDPGYLANSDYVAP